MIEVTDDELSDRLNELGRTEWELMVVHPSAAVGNRLVLKRAVVLNRPNVGKQAAARARPRRS